MLQNPIISFFLACLAGLLLVWFQYVFQSKSKPFWVLLVLRFVSWLALCLLVFNPKMNIQTQNTQKPTLVVLADNSSSVKYLKADHAETEFLQWLQSDTELSEKFDVQTYTFGKALKNTDSLTFETSETNLSEPFLQLKQLYKTQNMPAVLLTDGRQTVGADYEFSANNTLFDVYTVVLGDTVRHPDLKITQVNTNGYSYLGNAFPVEVLTAFEGKNNTLSTRLEVRLSDKLVHAETLTFSETNKAHVSRFTIKSETVGMQKMTINLLPFENEKNIQNNRKETVVEIIDQQSKILIVSDLTHPDLGAFRKAITSSKFRQVAIVKPNQQVDLNDYVMVIRHQPTADFSEIDKQIRLLQKNTLTIIGTKADLDYQETFDPNIALNDASFAENIQGKQQPDFKSFYLDDIGFESLPPLKGIFMDINPKIETDVFLTQVIAGNPTEKPLWLTYEQEETKHAVLFAENVWQWRAQSFLNSGSFAAFDGFVTALVQYLSSNKRRDRLQLDYQPVLESVSEKLIKARFFDKIFNFDPRANLRISLTNAQTNEKFVFPFLLKGSFYEADLAALPPGDYQFETLETNENISQSGQITVLDFDAEKLFINADYEKLQRLSSSTEGAVFFPNQFENLKTALLQSDNYKAVLKTESRKVSIISWQWLLLILLGSLGAEWLLRKYRGLI
ncbi:MAG: VWA domain-containing protein [Bacteroidetes bacterium]|nr:VWA domain-containing protein [Bacteroidota bacterium]